MLLRGQPEKNNEKVLDKPRVYISIYKPWINRSIKSEKFVSKCKDQELAY